MNVDISFGVGGRHTQVVVTTDGGHVRFRCEGSQAVVLECLCVFLRSLPGTP